MSNLGYQVAIKTGSPQVDNNTTNSALIGFAPVDNPEIAVGVMLEEGETPITSCAVFWTPIILPAERTAHTASKVKREKAPGKKTMTRPLERVRIRH